MLESDDHFLLGVDLVKDIPTMVAAYNDSAGVTTEFTRNILRVVNRELTADFDVDAFEHVAHWNEDLACMEAWLRATRSMTVHVRDIGLTVEVAQGEMIHTEVSCKFTRQSVETMFADAGFKTDGWFTDPAGRFALALARPVARYHP